MRQLPRYLGIVLALLLTAACQSDEKNTRARYQKAMPPAGEISFVYPVMGQTAVPVEAPVVIHLRTGNASAEQFRIEDDAGREIGAEFRPVDGTQAVHLVPDAALTPGATYSVTADGALLNDHAGNWPLLTQFTTAAGTARSGDSPRVVAVSPGRLRQPAVMAANKSGDEGGDAEAPGPAVADSMFPLTTVSSIRIEFDDRIDPATAIAGETVHLRYADDICAPSGLTTLSGGSASDGCAIAGFVLAQGHKLVFNAYRPLQAGRPLLLQLTDGIRGAHGKPIAGTELSLEPAVAMWQDDTRIEQRFALKGSADGSTLSPLTGMRRNAMQIGATLIGDYDLDMQGGMKALVGDPRNFPRLIPFSIPRGQRLSANGLDLKLAGMIPAKLNGDDPINHTGELAIEFLTDANGYFYDNPYSPVGAKQPVYAVLEADIAISAAGDGAQAIFNQQMIGFVTAGHLVPQDGRLHLDLLGMLDIAVLGGTSRGMAVAALSLEGPEDEPPAPAPEPLRLIASIPAAGEQASAHDDIVLVFSNPLEPASVSGPGAVLLQRNGSNVGVKTLVDGSSLIVRPDGALAPGSYQLSLQNLQGVSGGLFAGTGAPIAFTVPDIGNSVSPQLTGLNVGVPCALTGGNFNTGGNIAGHCIGGQPGETYQVFRFPHDWAVEAYFTRPVQLGAGIVLSENCGAGLLRLERVVSGQCAEAVPGHLQVRGNRLRIVPLEPLQIGERYQLVMAPEAIYSGNAKLNTTPLAGRNPGSHVLTMPFEAVANEGSIYTSLHAMPYADANGDGGIGDGEIAVAENSLEMTIAGRSGQVRNPEFTDANAFADGNSTISFKNYSLMVAIDAGRYHEEEGYIPVRVSPQVLLGTGVDMALDFVGGLFGLKLATSAAETGQLYIRLAEESEGRIERGPDGKPWFSVETPIYIDAPDMDVDVTLLGSLGGDALVNGRDLIRSQAARVILEGAVEFTPDGRMLLNLSNRNRFGMVIDIRPAGGILGSGTVTIAIPENKLQLQLIGPPLRGNAALEGMFR